MRLTAAADADPAVVGAKAYGLIRLMRLGLPVPAGFVLTSRTAGELPPLHGPVSVRSGARVSMPGMMDTVLDVAPADVPAAIEAVFDSWNTPRAKIFRALHQIPDDLGTAVIVQDMVYGDRDSRSATGVAFSRDPNTGEPVVFGDVLFGQRGPAVVSGSSPAPPVGELASRLPAVWSALRDALTVLERDWRDVCQVEFTVESGKLWFLQVRPGGLAGRAAIRVAVDLADAGLISRSEAVDRVSAQQLAAAQVPRLTGPLLARGQGASPGVATGRIALTSQQATRMDGPVILVRPVTSPLDMPGLAAAAGVLTSRGGPSSHAAVVARSLGKPAVVNAPDVVAGPCDVRIGSRRLPEGTLLTIDGSGGEIALGAAPTVPGAADPALQRLTSWRTAGVGGREHRRPPSIG